jgi:hypothetical protein
LDRRVQLSSIDTTPSFNHGPITDKRGVTPYATI